MAGHESQLGERCSTNEPLQLLQVEDSEEDADLIVRMLRKSGFDVHAKRVDDGETMRAALARQSWDVIVSDHALSRFDATAALSILQESGVDIPFIVVSGSIDQDLAVEMMRRGAHDYIMKTGLVRLAPAVGRELREARSRRERRRAEQSLRESEERLALALQATNLGTFDLYPQTGKLIWSDSMKQHFGLPPEAEITPETFLVGVHPGDRERIRGIMQNALRPGGDGEYAAEYRAIGIQDRVERRLAAWGRVYFDAQGQPVRFVGVNLDISERKRLEAQFMQAQKLEGVGRLAGGVAHDFNNLLTVITGYAQMLMDELPVDHSLRDGVEEIAKSAMRASNLTRQLLTFSRDHVTESKRVALNDLVRDFEKMLGRLIGEDVQVVISLHPDAGTLRADPNQIEQIIMNLAVNARDAMPGGGKLIIETAPFFVDERYAHMHASMPPGQYVMLSVSDTGCGMPPEVKAHVFEPFFTTKELGKGTGLGLSTVYGIVMQAGGTISVYSEPGHGCTFRMLFPAVAGERESKPGAPVEGSFFGDETILVAEDAPGVRKYIRKILQGHGYKVLEAANGRHAIELARQHRGPIHLLLTDAVMPEMGGVELSAQFLAIRPGIAVLSMSGYSDRMPAQAELHACYIQKPFTPEALLSRIRTLLSSAVWSGGPDSD